MVTLKCRCDESQRVAYSHHDYKSDMQTSIRLGIQSKAFSSVSRHCPARIWRACLSGVSNRSTTKSSYTPTKTDYTPTKMHIESLFAHICKLPVWATHPKNNKTMMLSYSNKFAKSRSYCAWASFQWTHEGQTTVTQKHCKPSRDVLIPSSCHEGYWHLPAAAMACLCQHPVYQWWLQVWHPVLDTSRDERTYLTKRVCVCFQILICASHEKRVHQPSSKMIHH